MAETNTAGTAAATDTSAAAATSADTTTSAASTAATTTTAAADTKTVTASTTSTAKADTAGGTDATQTKSYWPDDWLTRVAKGDEKRAKQLGRYASPEALADAHIELRRRMDSGDIRTALPKDAKPEELAAWRKDNGIPDKPEAYDLTGLEYPEEDKDIVSGFLKAAHERSMTPEQARATLDYYYGLERQNIEARQQQDEKQRTAALDALNQEWGQSFRRNVNLIEGTVLSKFPESVRELLKQARMADGTLLFNSPDAIRGFAALALEINPAGVVAPGGVGDLGRTMVDEYNALQKEKSENRKAWNADTAKQERERELIDAMLKNGLMDKNGQILRKAA